MHRAVVYSAAFVGMAIAGWGVYCLVTTRSFLPWIGSEREVPPSPPGRPGTYTADILQRWVDSPNEVKTTPPPSGARPVTLVYPRSTAPFDRNANTGSREIRRAMFAYLRKALRDAGRGNEDVRVTMLRVAIESGWLRRGRSFYNNWGNIKAQNHVWCTSKEDAKAGRNLKTDIGDATVIFVLKDRLNSVDAYPGFPEVSQYLAFDKRLLTRRYPDALAGAIEGGERGLIKAETALGRGGYSSAPTAVRLVTAAAYWRIQRNLFGAENWDDRAAFDRYLDGASETIGR